MARLNIVGTEKNINSKYSLQIVGMSMIINDIIIIDNPDFSHYNFRNSYESKCRQEKTGYKTFAISFYKWHAIVKIVSKCANHTT